MGRRKRESSPEVPTKRRMRNRGDESSEDENDEERQPAALLSQTSSSGSLVRAILKDIELNIRSGKILKIHLKNFMCHKNLVVEFNKRANLLVGNNGSGKSAVLAALTIGLGSKANSTNRSSSVKQFIKHGEQTATIEIHLENDSFDAFERELYGDRIIIVRTIQSSGGSVYKLKNESGHVISTSRNDLLKLCLYLNIQVDNPVCVLNQDLARSFLKDSDPKKQYQLFLKATQIDAITNKLNECTPEYDNAKHRLECEEKNFQFLEKNIEEIQGKYESLQSVEILKQGLQKHKIKLGWLRVIEKEKKNETIEAQLREKIGEIKGHMGTIENKYTMEREINHTITTYKTEIDSKKASTIDVKVKYTEIRAIVQKLNDNMAEQKRQYKKLREKITRQETDINNIETDLNQRTESSTNRITEEKRRNEEMLDKLTNRRNELKSIVENAKRDIEALHNTIAQVRDTKDELMGKKTTKQHELSKTDAQLRQFEASSRDNLSIYGQNMPKLVARIKQLHEQGKFSELPRGPLGKYMKIKDKKWCSIIETLAGNVLTAFYVNSDADRMTLNNLIKKEFPDLQGRSVITGKFCNQVYDVRSGMVSEVSNTHLLMKLININDPVVMNCFIDQVKCETILLVEDQDLAMNLTSEEENVPRNLQKVILMNPLSEFYPAPLYRSYAVKERQARYLQVNMSELKQQTQRRKKDLEEELEQLQAAFQQEHTNIEGKQRNLRDKQNQLAKLENEMTIIENKMRDLREIEYPAESEEETLIKELEELKTSVAALNEKEDEMKAKMKALLQDIKENEDNMNIKKNDLNSIEAKIADINNEIDNEQQKLHDLNANAKTRQQQVARLNIEIKELQSTRNSLKQELETLVEQANEVGARVNVEENEDTLNKNIAVAEKKIRRICSSNENIDDVKTTLDMKLNIQAYKLRFNEILRQVIKTLHTSRTLRYQYLYKLKTHMSLRVKHRFNGVMQLRNYIGEIKMDQKQGELELSVIPRDKHIVNAVSNTKSLSGGERSYATVAFLISLWSCVDTPFYFLDEYDVFTDQVNRHTMTLLLLNEADKKADRQFTFLTPQDMSNIQATDALTIHRMEDPERC